jgi:hypothetical protein
VIVEKRFAEKRKKMQCVEKFVGLAVTKKVCESRPTVGEKRSRVDETASPEPIFLGILRRKTGGKRGLLSNLSSSWKKKGGRMLSSKAAQEVKRTLLGPQDVGRRCGASSGRSHRVAPVVIYMTTQ